MLSIIADGHTDGLSRYVEGKEPRYVKGPNDPTDLAYTERVIFG
jgi:hypothetical protein